jgi:hypothetical protein
MIVNECSIGAEYAINGRVWLMVGRSQSRDGIFVSGSEQKVLGKDETVFEVIIHVDKKWCLWHDGCKQGIEVYHFNDDVWVRAEDLV